MNKNTPLEFVEKKVVSVIYRGRYLTRLRDVPNPSRHIFMHKDFVVKVDHRPAEQWQTRQTEREIAFYETLTEDKQHFAQILDYGKTPRGLFWLKQKRYYPDEKFTGDWRLTLDALRYKYLLNDVWGGEGLHNNWFCVGEEVIIYDWGCYGVNN